MLTLLPTVIAGRKSRRPMGGSSQVFAMAACAATAVGWPSRGRGSRDHRPAMTFRWGRAMSQTQRWCVSGARDESAIPQADRFIIDGRGRERTPSSAWASIAASASACREAAASGVGRDAGAISGDRSDGRADTAQLQLRQGPQSPPSAYPRVNAVWRQWGGTGAIACSPARQPPKVAWRDDSTARERSFPESPKCHERPPPSARIGMAVEVSAPSCGEARRGPGP